MIVVPSDPAVSPRHVSARVIDPRTVPRRTLLDKAGFTRPDITLVIAAESTVFPMAEVRPNSEEENTASARQRLMVNRADALASPGDTFLSALNSTAARAIGEIVVFVFGMCTIADPCLVKLVDRFRNDANLAVVDGFEIEDPGPFLAVRGDVLTALGGFAEEFQSSTWAIRDFCQRARAIGYRTPDAAPKLDDGSDSKADEALFYKRDDDCSGSFASRQRV